MHKTTVQLFSTIVIVAIFAGVTFIASCSSELASTPGQGKLEALGELFPSMIEAVDMQLSQDVRDSGRPAGALVSKVVGPDGTLGYSVDSEVTGRSGPFNIQVVLDDKFTVKRATVLSYRWTHGRGVLKRSFTEQFEGKGSVDPIRLGKDIDAISGATISSRVMTQGVRDSIGLVKQLSAE